MEQTTGPYPLPHLLSFKKNGKKASEILPFSVIGKQRAACTKTWGGKTVDLCWKNHGGPVNPPHINIKTWKKSDDIKRHDAEKIYERSPCAVNKKRGNYSKLQIPGFK